MAKRKIARKLVHTAVDAVTHKPVVTIRDEVWHAVNRAVGAIESECCRMPTAASAPWYALVREALGLLVMLESATDADLATVRAQGAPDVPEPLAAVAREYAKLDASDRFRFLAAVREQVGKMLPHTN